jgi:hypothetical protein
MDRQDGGNRFDLKYDLMCDNDVALTLADDRNGNLPFECMPASHSS